MIEKFHITDLEGFEPNEFTDPSTMGYAFEDPEFYHYTLRIDGVVLAIISARPYWEDNFVVCALISKHFRARHSKQMREFIRGICAEHKLKRLQTDSIAHPLVDKWHKDMGFTYEGTRRKMMFGKDFNCWGMLLEE